MKIHFPITIHKKIELKDGSSIAVVGGGPSGSFFTYFALDLARRYDLKINIDVYEAKDFTSLGPAGCNNCGGIISESLVQMLSTDGIILPSTIIRRGIYSYTLHMEQGKTIIYTPKKEQKIASVFRGSGPKNFANNDQLSFDNYLLGLCEKNGANIIIDRITEAERVASGIIIRTKNSIEKKYDLVVGAAGLNSKTLELFKSICPGFVPPATIRAYISEFPLESEIMERYFDNSMHVFLLNLPKITFGALIPKGKYVTLVLLGDEMSKETVERFLAAKQVKECFPPDTRLKDAAPCKCFPFINISASRNPYHDRVVLVGDSASSKLYKNGIGAAYLTGRAAARTAIFHGISKSSFKKSYYPVCKNLNLDNNVGKFIFWVTRIIQKSDFLKKGLFQMVANEQRVEVKKRVMSSVLWDTFTGSAGYRNIFIRFLDPRLLMSFLWNIITSNIKPNKISYHGN
jgi:flavin-dependent dehydrogenase